MIAGPGPPSGRAGHTVSADLLFNEHDQLVDFSSDDRYAASPDGKTFQRRRWSTPLHNYRSFHGRTISASGLACWEASEPDGQFAYLDIEVDEITYQPGVAQELPATSASEEAA